MGFAFEANTTFDIENSDILSKSTFGLFATAIIATAINTNTISVNTPVTKQITITQGEVTKPESHYSSPNVITIKQVKNNDLRIKNAGEILTISKELGLTNVKLAKVLKVSRENVQKWANKPTTEPQQDTLARASVLAEFRDLMKIEHRKFLAKLTSGPLEIDEISSALEGSKLDVKSLELLYKNHYLKFDGAYKRSLM